MTVYLLSDGDYLKIGHTSRDIEVRMREIQTGSPNTIRLINFLPDAPIEVERELHRKFANLRVRANGEWFIASDEIEVEFANRRNLIDRQFLRNAAEQQRRAEAVAFRRRKRQERRAEVRKLPIPIRIKWYLKRLTIAAVTVTGGALLIWFSPKEPIQLWGTFRIIILFLTPFCAYSFGKKLPPEE